MIKHIVLIALLAGLNWDSFAQISEAPVAELSSAPPALAPAAQTTPPTQASDDPEIKLNRKVRYGLSAGTQFSRLFGTATYLEPSVLFPVTKRFSGFASVNLVTSFGPNRNMFGTPEGDGHYARLSNQRVILNAGGNYMVNDRLNLTGSVWRDLSKTPMPAGVNLLMPGGTNGMSLRANYKVSEHFSVSGGFRYSNGNAYQSGWYNPGSPFGY